MKAKTKTCKICKAKFVPERQFQNWCTPNCGYELVRMQKANSEKRKKQKSQKKIREMKERLKTKSEYMKEAQASVNAYIRFRDDGKPCISCGVSISNRRVLGMRGGNFDAGHYRSRGSAPHIKFYTLNIFGQCKKCNRYLSGNSIEMRRGIIARYNIELIEKLEAMYFEKKYDIEYLKRVKRIFNKKVRLIKKIRGDN